jgi:2,5-diketo-D-gluconate reductase A
MRGHRNFQFSSLLAFHFQSRYGRAARLRSTKGIDVDANSETVLHTGNRMPVLGLGTWQLTDDTPGTVENALRLGYRLIDTSGDYGTQPGIGEGIRRSGIERSGFYLVTKVEETDDSYEATVKNLAELGLDQADLMLIHRPPSSGPGEALWRGLIRAKEDGLTRDIGVSNYSIKQIEALIEATGKVPVVNQIEWSPFGRNAPLCEGKQHRHPGLQPTHSHQAAS